MRTRLPGTGFVIAAGFLALAPRLEAQVARVFVSINGNDGNTCSNVATPCRTFLGGIGQVDPGGEIIVLDAGSYGGVTITKAVTINVPPGIVAFTAQPIVINAGVSDVVTLRGLTVKALTPGSGQGITFNTGASLHLENCVVNGWSVGVEIFVGRLEVQDTTVKNCTAAGFYMAGSVSASINRTTVINSNFGYQAIFGASVTIRDSVASGNVEGFYCVNAAVPTPTLMTLDHCTATGNTRGMVAKASATRTSILRIANSSSTQNGTGVAQAGNGGVETIISLGNNFIEGNTTDVTGSITVVTGK